jgi:hypothetical protein
VLLTFLDESTESPIAVSSLAIQSYPGLDAVDNDAALGSSVEVPMSWKSDPQPMNPLPLLVPRGTLRLSMLAQGYQPSLFTVSITPATTEIELQAKPTSRVFVEIGKSEHLASPSMKWLSQIRGFDPAGLEIGPFSFGEETTGGGAPKRWFISVPCRGSATLYGGWHDDAGWLDSQNVFLEPGESSEVTFELAELPQQH